MQVDIFNMPQELIKRPKKALPAWAACKGKEAYNPKKPRSHATTRNPETWGTFGEAFSVYLNGGFDGIAFALWESEPYCLIDLDDCRDPETGEIEPRAQGIIAGIQSYTEISPSGCGVHIILKGKRPRDENGKPLDGRISGRKEPVTWESGKEGLIEMYDHGHSIRMTGQHLEGTPDTIEHRQTQLEVLYQEVWGEAENEAGGKPAPEALALPDRRIISLAHRAANGEKFARLFQGEWKNNYPSKSEADQAMCAMLAFYTRDSDQIERIMSASGLKRHKWTNRPEYRQTTIDKALGLVDRVYDPNYGLLPDRDVWMVPKFEVEEEDGPSEPNFPLVKPTPVDELHIFPNGIWLGLDYAGVVKEVCDAGLQGKLQALLEPILREMWAALKTLAKLPGLTEAIAQAKLEEIKTACNRKYRIGLDRFYRKYLTFPIPTNPITQHTLGAIYSGGDESTWDTDQEGKPAYHIRQNNYQITISFDSAPETGETVTALWDLVKRLSVETGDVFLILLEKLVRLDNPKQEYAIVKPEDIAQRRGVEHRHGSMRVYHEALKEQVLQIAKLRLTMTWRNKRNKPTGASLTFGKDSPEPLIHIVDWVYEQDGKTWTAFTLRPGQALSYFLDREEGLRWIGYYSQALIRLDPYHEALPKKLGAFWLIRGEISGKYGQQPRATIRTLLTQCGLPLAPKRPDRVVSALKAAHLRLFDLGVLEEVSCLEPDDRKAGYFQRWLNKVVTVRLNPPLFDVSGLKFGGKAPKALLDKTTIAA